MLKWMLALETLHSHVTFEDSAKHLLIRGTDLPLSQIFLDLSEGWSPSEISQIRSVSHEQLRAVFCALAQVLDISVHEMNQPVVVSPLVQEPFKPLRVESTPLPLDVRGPAEGCCWTCGAISAVKFCTSRCRSVWNLKEREKLLAPASPEA